MSEITIDSNEYLNIKIDGELRVSLSEEHNEILVYQDGVDNPVQRFDLDGNRKP